MQRFKPVIVTEQYLGKRHQRDYPEMQTSDTGEYVLLSEASSLLTASEARVKRLEDALVECRWRLAANQPMTRRHPNDIKALDMAETVLTEGEKG